MVNAWIPLSAAAGILAGQPWIRLGVNGTDPPPGGSFSTPGTQSELGDTIQSQTPYGHVTFGSDATLGRAAWDHWLRAGRERAPPEMDRTVKPDGADSSKMPGTAPGGVFSPPGVYRKGSDERDEAKSEPHLGPEAAEPFPEVNTNRTRLRRAGQFCWADFQAALL